MQLGTTGGRYGYGKYQLWEDYDSDYGKDEHPSHEDRDTHDDDDEVDPGHDDRDTQGDDDKKGEPQSDAVRPLFRVLTLVFEWWGRIELSRILSICQFLFHTFLLCIAKFLFVRFF